MNLSVILEFSFRYAIVTPKIFPASRRQRGRVVKAWDLKSGDPEFGSRSDHSRAGFVPGSPWFNSSAALVQSPLVCLLPVGMLNLLRLFQLFVS